MLGPKYIHTPHVMISLVSVVSVSASQVSCFLSRTGEEPASDCDYFFPGMNETGTRAMFCKPLLHGIRCQLGCRMVPDFRFRLTRNMIGSVKLTHPGIEAGERRDGQRCPWHIVVCMFPAAFAQLPWLQFRGRTLNETRRDRNKRCMPCNHELSSVFFFNA